MESASCSTMVTELDTKEMLPIIKLVPFVMSAAEIKVNNSTGTSAQVWEVSSRMETTMMATNTLIIDICCSISSAEASPMEVDT